MARTLTESVYRSHLAFRARGQRRAYEFVGVLTEAIGSCNDLRVALGSTSDVNALAALLVTGTTPGCGSSTGGRCHGHSRVYKKGLSKGDLQPRTLSALRGGTAQGLPASGAELRDLVIRIGETYRQQITSTNDLPRRAKKRARRDANLLLAARCQRLEHLLRAVTKGDDHAMLASLGLSHA